jgi:hypothetical protein
MALPRGVLKCYATAEVSPEAYDPKFRPVGKQTIEDTGPLNTTRMETIDDDIADATVDYIRRQHEAQNPFSAPICSGLLATLHIRSRRVRRVPGARGILPRNEIRSSSSATADSTLRSRGAIQ